MKTVDLDALHDRLDWHYIEEFCAQACAQYRETAPVTARWVDAIYMRLQDAPEAVSYFELMQMYRLREAGHWEQGNFAANRAYKVMQRLGQDVTGLAGY